MIAWPDPIADALDYAEQVVAGSIASGRYAKLACQRHLDDLKNAGKRGFYFDKTAALQALQFFPKILRHSLGEFCGHPFELAQWQKFVVASLFGWHEAQSKLRRFRKAYMSVARKNGKGLALDTPIPTPSGWTTMGELKAGDMVFDDNGLPCSVSFLSEVSNIDCYRLTFSNGESVVCDGEHLWVTKARIARAGHGHNNTPCPSVQVRNVRQLRDTVTAGSRGDRNHSLEMPQPIQCDEKTLPIDPYVLGAWLGDGHTTAAKITCSIDDIELIDSIRDRGHIVTAKTRAAGKAVTYAIQNDTGGKCGRGHDEAEKNGSHCRACEREIDRNKRNGTPISARINISFQEQLKSLGVFGKKHIPAAYLRSSFSQRLSLLQGLMDTDGYINKNGRVLNFDTTCELLRDGVAELLASLGVKFTIIKRTMRCNGRDIDGNSWRFQFMAFREVLPCFRLTRKLERMRNTKECKGASRSRTVQLVSVTTVESVPTKCIQVDSPSRQYLCGKTMLPTHNTTLVSGIAAKLLFFDDEPGAEVYCTATKEEQAKIMYRETLRMVEQSPALWKRSKVRKQPASISVGHSVFKPLGSDGKSTDGLNPHGILVDELHAWRERHRDFKERLESGSGSRRQPLEMVITTAGDDKSQLWIEEDEYACKVVEESAFGRHVDDSYFSFVCRCDDEDDVFEESNWSKANPNLGVSVKLDYLRSQANEAKNRPTETNKFIRFHANRRTGSHEVLIPRGVWDINAGALEVADGATGYGGIDIGRSNDWAAVGLVFPKGDGTYDIQSAAWTCRNGAFQVDREPFRSWIGKGLLNCCEGTAIDPLWVIEWIVEQSQKYDVQSWAIDPNFAKLIGQMLQNDHGLNIFEFTQSPKFYNEATRKFEELAVAGKFRHGGDPVLAWQCGNMNVYRNAKDEWMPDKSNKESKIDAMVATLMAFSECLYAQKNDTPTMFIS